MTEPLLVRLEETALRVELEETLPTVYYVSEVGPEGRPGVLAPHTHTAVDITDFQSAVQGAIQDGLLDAGYF